MGKFIIVFSEVKMSGWDREDYGGRSVILIISFQFSLYFIAGVYILIEFLSSPILGDLFYFPILP